MIGPSLPVTAALSPPASRRGHDPLMVEPVRYEEPSALDSGSDRPTVGGLARSERAGSTRRARNAPTWRGKPLPSSRLASQGNAFSPTSPSPAFPGKGRPRGAPPRGAPLIFARPQPVDGEIMPMARTLVVALDRRRRMLRRAQTQGRRLRGSRDFGWRSG
jgi:hypothetical protein